jgi:hypothetical protein
MLFIRNRVEEMCHKLDIRDPVVMGQHLDKYSLEEYARIEGGGEAAVETVKIWTRVMLGNSTGAPGLKICMLISKASSHHKSVHYSSSIIARTEED